MSYRLQVSSDSYIQLRPECFPRIREFQNPAQENLAIQSCIEFLGCVKRSKYSWDEAPYKEDVCDLITRTPISFAFVNSLIVKTLAKVENTDGYCEYTLLKLFGDGNHRTFGPPPSTIRIYSPTLACFYDGKNWKKIE